LDSPSGLQSNASDRAAIMEAKHLARLIRGLAAKSYRGDPHDVATERWLKGECSL